MAGIIPVEAFKGPWRTTLQYFTEHADNPSAEAERFKHHVYSRAAQWGTCAVGECLNLAAVEEKCDAEGYIDDKTCTEVILDILDKVEREFDPTLYEDGSAFHTAIITHDTEAAEALLESIKANATPEIRKFVADEVDKL